MGADQSVMNNLEIISENRKKRNNKHKKAIYDKFSDIYKKCVEDQSNKLAEYARQDCLADLIIRMHAENQNSLMEINYASGATTYNNMYELNRDFGYER